MGPSENVNIIGAVQCRFTNSFVAFCNLACLPV